MLQQTTVRAVIPFYHRWMEVYPDVSRLSRAREREVLLLWEGLGYYNRARNLLESARIVMDRYGGSLPREYSRLRSLPGIGDYTARAILSICFGEPTPAVDANIRRVGRRLHAWRSWRRVEEHQLFTLLSELMPPDRPGEFNEALMELGETVCLGGRPLCATCPLSAGCRAFLTGQQEGIPPRRGTQAVRAESRRLLLVRPGESAGSREVLLLRRETGILKGLWLFPSEADLGCEEGVGSDLEELLIPLGRLRRRVHSYTRTREGLQPVAYSVPRDFEFPAENAGRTGDTPGSGKALGSGGAPGSGKALGSGEPPHPGEAGKPEGRWIRLPALASHPMPSVYRKIAADLLRLLADPTESPR
jgi:A/G-specific adenine glycosylase